MNAREKSKVKKWCFETTEVMQYMESYRITHDFSRLPELNQRIENLSDNFGDMGSNECYKYDNLPIGLQMADVGMALEESYMLLFGLMGVLNNISIAIDKFLSGEINQRLFMRRFNTKELAVALQNVREL